MKKLAVSILVVAVLVFAFWYFTGDSNIDTSEDTQNSTNGSGAKLRAMECPEVYRNSSVCTREYIPVCGWFNASEIQCTTYPCAIDAGNVCEACSNSAVEYYTEGMCPNPQDGALI